MPETDVTLLEVKGLLQEIADRFEARERAQDGRISRLELAQAESTGRLKAEEGIRVRVGKLEAQMQETLIRMASGDATDTQQDKSRAWWGRIAAGALGVLVSLIIAGLWTALQGGAG